MKVRSDNLSGNVPQTVACNLPNDRQWRQSLDEATALMFHPICRVLADLVNERDGLNR